MKIGSVIGLPVMAMKEGTQQGQVVDAVIDAERKVVSHYLISKDSKYDLLLVEASVVTGIGDDYLVLMDAADIRRVLGDPKRMEAVSRGFYLADATALSSSGAALGTVADFEYDEATGDIEKLILTDGREFPADDIVAMSGTTVFVQGANGKKAAIPRAPKQTVAVEEEVAEEEPEQTEEEVQQVTPKQAKRRGGVPVQAQRAYQNGASPAEALRDFSSKQQRSNSNTASKVNFRKMLIGKKMARDVVSDDGVFKANEGDTITEWMVQLAEQHNALQLLMKHIEPS